MTGDNIDSEQGVIARQSHKEEMNISDKGIPTSQTMFAPQNDTLKQKGR